MFTQQDKEEWKIMELADKLKTFKQSQIEEAKRQLFEFDKEKLVETLYEIFTGSEKLFLKRIRAYIKKINSSSWHERDKVIDDIANLGEPAKKPIKKLMQEYKQKNLEIYLRLKSALAKIKNAKPQDIKKHRRAQLEILKILLDIADAKIIPNIVDTALASPEMRIRLEAIAAIKTRKLSKIFKKIINDLQNYPFTRSEKIYLIHMTDRFVDENLIEKIFEIMKKEKDLLVKIRCLQVLVEFKHSEGIRTAVKFLSSDNIFIRNQSFAYLIKLTQDDFGYDPQIQPQQQKKEIEKFKRWWEKNFSEFRDF